MKFIRGKNTLDYPVSGISPIRGDCRAPIGPGMFDVNGAMALQLRGELYGSHPFGTNCELLLFHREKKEPYAVLPFPDKRL